MACVNDGITFEYKRNAVEFWKPHDTGKTKLFETVKRRFRKVTSLRQLQRWQEQVNRGGTRLEKWKRISSYTLDKFQEALERGVIIHDIDIVRWVLKAKEEINLPEYGASATCGFQLECHSGCSLAIRGSKKIECTAQSISATTHSYTIQPTISGDGRLLSPFSIVLKEPTGSFGPPVQETMFRERNLSVLASKSGKLTSHHFEIWLREVYFPNVGPKSVLLLDSWTGHCPDVIARNKPESARDSVFLTIPAGTTGQRQPLDGCGKNNLFHDFWDTPCTCNELTSDEGNVSIYNSEYDRNESSEEDNNAEEIIELRRNDVVCHNDNHVEIQHEISNEDGDGCQYIQKFLASWANECNISFSALSSLLRGLKKLNGLDRLPSDPRTLLKTPRFTNIFTVAPGKYYHFGLKQGILNILSKTENLPECVQLCINIDGLPIFKSTEKQFWPILGSIHLYETVFPIGIYYGSEKPLDVNHFLSYFIADATKLCTEGINVKNKNISCILHALICDAPARAFALQVKGHTGYNSCFKCTIKGRYTLNRVCFPRIDAPSRTDDDFKAKTDEDYHKDNVTCDLLKIPHFGPVTNVPLDYMHLVCLGIVRKIVNLLLTGDLKYRIGRFSKERISSSLISYEKWMSRVFVRKPRSLKHVAMWKATEFRQLLLYIGPIALKYIRSDIYNHFISVETILHIYVLSKYV
ncbi:PREDICTED: uncharacterized protein LOC105555999 [Vollenhovia emeryi]|uniref:uncharacterized protein LOC105555999 n=1 Tax=Vollenhovia emeryi TaxID=411798 RepID=UPI0005F3BDE4|nr:PREDICTED: uncharacterized protein LOC105555999 [Vollenhovia emeryi]